MSVHVHNGLVYIDICLTFLCHLFGVLLETSFNVFFMFIILI